MEGGWPLVGRDDELEEIARSFEVARGAVVAGPAGVGRTRLVRDASSQVSGHVESFSGASTAPFGTFARLLTRAADGPVIDRFRAAADELAASGGDVVVTVDDAHLLDDLSVAFLHHLVDATPVRLLLTACDDAPVPGLLTRLWKDGALVHVPLRPLTTSALDLLVTAALPGEVDRGLRRWLVDTCAGNPLLLRELLADALERDAVALAGGRWQRRGPAGPPTARLREVVGVRQGSLDEAERAVAELLAVGGRLPLAVLEHLTSPEAVLGLERRELLVAVPDRRRVEVGLAHPVHAEVVLGELGPMQVRAHLRSLVVGVEGTGARRREDRLRLAQWRAQLGEVTDWRAMLDAARDVAGAPQREVAEVASAAAHPRRAQAHLLTALELAAAAEEHGGGLEAAILVRSLCLRLGDQAGAAAADARIDELATDEATRATVARLRELGTDQSKAAAGDEQAIAAAMLASGGRPEDAMDAAAAVLVDGGLASSDRLLALAARAGALCQLGRTAEAATVADEGLRTVGGQDAPGPVFALVIARLYANLLGGRLREAEKLATECREAAAQAGSDDGVSSIEVALASAALAQGRPATTVRWTSAALGKLDDPELRLAALAVEAHAAGTLGDTARAAAALDAIDTDPRRYAAITPQVERARAWAQVAAGRVSDAIDGLLASARACAAASTHAGELGLLHDVARLGRPELVADRVTAVVADMDDVLPPVVRDHVVALRDDDARALDAVAAAFAAMGAATLEAEAWAQASSAHRRAGSNARALASASRARAAAARCEGARTPGMVIPTPAPGLTPREREIAGLAARGLTDRAIADQLDVSIRTAETHLRNAYAKLGVTGRVELRAALDAAGE